MSHASCWRPPFRAQPARQQLSAPKGLPIFPEKCHLFAAMGVKLV